MNSFVSKIVNSKPVQKVANSKLFIKALDAGTAVTAAVSALAVNACAEGTDIGAIVTASANVDQIMANATPFIGPAIVIMCSFTGVRMGMKFLRGAAK